MSRPASRRGVASIVGTMIFLVVFMLALGSLAYALGVQEQTSQVVQEAEATVAARGSQSLSYEVGQNGLSATDTGPGTITLSYLVLRFPNGTVYALPVDASIPMEANISVAGLVPQEVCSPGAATCVSDYRQILAGNPRGSSVGLVTSMGNTYWYSASVGPSGGSEAVFKGSGTWNVPPGVTAVYVVCIGGGGGGGGSGSATYVSGASGTGGGAGGGVGSLAQGVEELVGTGSVEVTVGQGGAGGGAGAGSSGGPGGDGGTSSFGGLLACAGGQGGGGNSYNINAGEGASCAPSASPPGGSGDGVPGGSSSDSGVPANAIQQTSYGGGGGGGSDIYTPPGEGSASDSLTSGTVYTSAPGASGSCAMGGGGGSASPFGDGGTGGSGSVDCAPGQAGGSPYPNTGAGGGGAGGSYSTSTACGTTGGAPGGGGGSGEVIIYYNV